VGENGRFDESAGDYDSIVQRAIGPSGETVAFFADLKVRLMAEAFGQSGPATILDFGCGIGNTTRAIARCFAASRVIGFDVSHESIAVARRLTAQSDFERISFSTASNGQLPFADASLAAGFTSCVFHHIDINDRQRWAEQLRRVIAPGGLMFLFEHNPYNPLTRHVVRRVPFDEGVLLVRPRDAVTLLQSAGFVVDAPYFYFFFPAFLRHLRFLEPLLRRVPLGAQYFVVGR
jgi:ubiquinone/menaquinone biosynthesis C-methylase UbiE